MGRTDDPTPAVPAALNLSHEQFQQLLAAISGPTANPELVDAVKSMKAMADAANRTQRHSNVDHEHKSPFSFDAQCEYCKAGARHPENDKLGHPKTALKYRTFFCGALERADALTELEVKLYNSFTVSKTARKGTWKAILDVDGSAEVLKVDVPFQGMDVRSDLPPLAQILFELVSGGEDAVTPQNQVAMLLALQQRIKELESAQAPVGAR